MLTKSFTIPQPVISNPNCEYFAIRYRKIQPVVSAWNNAPNSNSNNFTLQLDFNSVYEIEATHHCCDGSDSSPRLITFNTASNHPIIYVCMIEVPVSDTCATTPGSCRNCEIKKSYKFRFYSNSNGSTQYNLQDSNLKLKVQQAINNVPQTPIDVSTNMGYNEILLFGGLPVSTYKETCSGGNSIVSTETITLLDGSFEEYPYNIISCVSNNPTLTETSNTDTGPGGIRTQKFQVGADILPGNKFQIGVYSVTLTIDAVTGDTPTSIAQKLANAVNNTTVAQWNQYGNHTGVNGFPPHATSSGSVVTITLNYQNQFFGAAYEH